MTYKILAAGSVALMGAGSLLGAATAANAFTAEDCGGTQADYWNYTDGYCEVGFEDTTEQSWTTPTQYSELWVLLVGGGGGASGDNDSIGYAGGGGDVVFADLSDIDPGTALGLQPGNGGPSDIGLDQGGEGNSSWVQLGAQEWEAIGGVPNNAFDAIAWGFCDKGTFFGWTPTVGQGPSHFDAAITVPDGSGTCGTGAPGYNPADESGTPAIFDDIDEELGAGGDIVVGTPGDFSYGGGAKVYIDTGSQVATMDVSGTDGAVIFRWTPYDLASTGVDAAPMGALAAGMLVAGGVGLAIARRARRSQ